MSKLNFLQFPREIRDMVYSFLHINPHECADNGRISGLSLQLLAVSPQIHNEASRILYGKQPIRWYIWFCSDYFHTDSHQPLLVQNYIHLIRDMEICVHIIQNATSLPSNHHAKDTLVECIGSTLPGRIFAEGNLKQITLAFYLEQLTPRAITHLNRTGALHDLPKWQRQATIRTINQVLCLDADQKRLNVHKLPTQSWKGKLEKTSSAAGG